MLSFQKWEFVSVSATFSGLFLALSLVTISLHHRLFFQHVLNHYLIFTHHKAVHFPSVPNFFLNSLLLSPSSALFLSSVNTQYQFLFFVYAFLLLLISLLRSEFCHLLWLLFPLLFHRMHIGFLISLRGQIKPLVLVAVSSLYPARCNPFNSDIAHHTWTDCICSKKSTNPHSIHLNSIDSSEFIWDSYGCHILWVTV